MGGALQSLVNQLSPTISGSLTHSLTRRMSVALVIVKATNGPRYVVGCRRTLDKTKLKQGTRVALDMTTLTIMRLVPLNFDKRGA